MTVTWENVSYSPAHFAAPPPGLAPISNVKLSSGVFYHETDEADHAKAAVLGAEVVDHLFDENGEPVGQKISINNVAFKVIGVMERKGTIATYNQDRQPLGEIEAEASIAAVLAALVVSVAVGILSGVYPAEGSARMTPIEALRYE